MMATEKRLIDAIALISKARRMETTDNNGIPLDTFAVPVLAIEDAPTVDAVEVVRCKDCRHWIERTADGIDTFHTCWFNDSITGRTHFCRYGERKDNG